MDPDAALVIGNRGVGRSFWASALENRDTRAAISAAYRRLKRRLDLDQVAVRFGFSNQEGGGDALVSSAQLADVPDGTPPDLIWRAVLVSDLAPRADTTIPKRFRELVAWVRENPDEQQAVIRRVDRSLAASGESVLFLFDQLEQLANDWATINRLTRGLLQTALAMKSHRSIRIKIFMRPDQAANDELFRFPDASKIRNGAVPLRWRAVDLYGLLFFELSRNDDSAPAFERACVLAGIDTNRQHHRLRIPVGLADDTETQHAVFDMIAGAYMGTNKKRGLPYTWIPLHLSDAKGEVSPRTFLRAMKVAAEHSPVPRESAIDFKGINDGVRAASDNRLAELQEDYTWVSRALQPLHRMEVPALPDEIHRRWIQETVVEDIVRNHTGRDLPLALALADLTSSSEAEKNEALQSLLQDIGVFDLRQNGRIDIPDIYRVRAGILRRGGVTPEQRRRL